MISTVYGVTEHRWAESWLRCRAHFQLNCHQDHGILPLISKNGVILKKQMSSECFAKHLRSAYDRFVPVAADTRRLRLTSHSAKATALSWCAKHGLPVSTRRMLGSHKEIGDKIVLVYSRDALSEPLRRLDEVITQIRIGKFHPDVGRSGMVASSPMYSSEESEPDWSDTCEVDEEKKWTSRKRLLTSRSQILKRMFQSLRLLPPRNRIKLMLSLRRRHRRIRTS